VSVVERVAEAPERLRQRLNLAIRAAAGIAEEPPVVCEDPALAFTPVDSVVRLVNGDLPAMMIGGLSALFFEMLHPLTMAGVAQHSRYRTDALDRVRRTADFIGVTTYGTRDGAEAAMTAVRAIHERVRGVADDGREYRASDPHLLSWIHCAGLSMFLASYRAFGPVELSAARADEYVAGASRVAAGLGADVLPQTVAELDAAIEAFRPELRLSADGAAARDFIARGVVRGPHQKAAYRLVVAAAQSLIEPWARDLLGLPQRERLNPALVRPATRALNAVVRVAVPPVVPATWRG
jgi:uncharacterized protein (DUF2236 family)